MRALIVEDDSRYGEHLKRLLSKDGFLVDLQDDPEEALIQGLESPYSIILLDLMLASKTDRFAPAVDGFSLLRRWRKRGVATPVLVLTASRTDLEDTTMSYEWDADYEIKRPGEDFDALLLAWARSRASRSASGRAGTPRVGHYGPVSVDLDLREVTLEGAPIDLSRTEYNVLMCLLKNAQTWMSVSDIAKAAFDANCENPSAQVYEYIKRIRQKIGFKAIRNQRGRGYRYALMDETA